MSPARISSFIFGTNKRSRALSAFWLFHCPCPCPCPCSFGAINQKGGTQQHIFLARDTYVQWAGVRYLGGDDGLVGVTGLGAEGTENKIDGLELLCTQSQVLVLEALDLTLLQTELDARGAHQPLSVNCLEGGASAEHLNVGNRGGGERSGALHGDLEEHGGVAEESCVGGRSSALGQNVGDVLAGGSVGHDLVVLFVTDTEQGSIVDYLASEGNEDKEYKKKERRNNNPGPLGWTPSKA